MKKFDREKLKEQVGKQLAFLWYVKRLKKWECVQKLFPKNSDESARRNSTIVFTRYRVLDYVLAMLPTRIDDKFVEKMLYRLAMRGLETNSDSLVLEVVDRVAKIHGLYKEKLEVAMPDLERDSEKAEHAKGVLRRAGIDPKLLSSN